VPKVRIAEHGLYVRSEPKGELGVGRRSAPTTVSVSLEMASSLPSDHHRYQLVADVIDPMAPTKVVHSASESGVAGNETLHLIMEVPSLKLWWSGNHTEQPSLYTLRAREPTPRSSFPCPANSPWPQLREKRGGTGLMHESTLLDQVSVSFGVRRAVFSADAGFLLNDVPVCQRVNAPSRLPFENPVFPGQY
jgi:hypothetical protein